MKRSQLQIRVSDSEKETLKNAASLAGQDLSSWVLSKLLDNPRLKFAGKISNLIKTSNSKNGRKFALAGIADFLKALNKEELNLISKEPLAENLDSFCSNYVAAMLEWSLHSHKLPAPRWLSLIEPLEKPYFATELKSLRTYLLMSSPAPFLARNIFIDTTLSGRI